MFAPLSTEAPSAGATGRHSALPTAGGKEKQSVLYPSTQRFRLGKEGHCDTCYSPGQPGGFVLSEVRQVQDKH